jgi:hypothetical protein
LQPFLDELPPEFLVIGERTMVAASHRGGSVYTDLAQLATPVCAELGAHMSFGICEPHLVSYYAQFNMQPYAMRQFFSEESGYIVPLVTLHDGLEPFGDKPPQCIRDIIDRKSAVVNGEVNGLDTYRAELHTAVARLTDRPSLFSGLTSAEIDSCCARSSLITCAAGDQILRTGGTAQNPFIVMSGMLEARQGDRVIRKLEPGDVFGESGWFGDDLRRADVFAIDDASRILALSIGTLRRLTDTDPELAVKVISACATMLWGRLGDAGLLTG